ncbi:histone-lysine N-methyltransferase SETMAR-like [Vespa crabro]|uniref:histone-lysine N-methyltransferase SETMAR-like n=1 Tax=Vespa crabro TaxID=7445 RepID=UPI001F028E13|nr:histone-lysine N-methyltransferase SETMAR-like [Vespa crabro]
MENNKQHFRHILLFYYRKGKNAVKARKKLIDVYGEVVLTVYASARIWFAKFRFGNFDVEDAPRSGRPVEANKDTIKALVDANRQITTREIGERLNLLNLTVYGHLKGLGLTSKLDIWLDKLNDALQQKRPELINRKGVMFHQDKCDTSYKFGHSPKAFTT